MPTCKKMMENITLFGIFFLQCLMFFLKHFIPDSFQSCQTRPFWAISSVCQIFHRCKFLVLVNGLVVQRWEFFDLFIELVKERIAKSQASFCKYYLVQLIEHPILRIPNFNFPNLRRCKVFFSF